MRKILMATVATAAMSFAMTGGAKAQPVKAPAPGTIVVNFHGALDFEGVLLNNPNIGSGSSLVKESSLSTVGYIRLYPGFDAMTLGGLQYGVATEFRDTTGNANGAGVNGNATSANGTVNLYVRRAYGYVGSKNSGFVRLGQTDSAFSLLSYGDLETFGDGQQWNTDLGTGAIVYSGKPNNLFAVSGALYTSSKIVYVSPSFAGLNFAVGFEPNSNGIGEGDATAGGSLGAADSSIPGSSTNRRRNTIDAMVGYTAKVDSALVKVSAGYLDASPLGNTTGAEPYKNMGVTQLGGQVTLAGVSLGVNYKYGSVNDGYAFLAAGQRKDSDLLVSGTYTIGPVILGASYFFNQSAGKYTIANHDGRTETNDGAAVGGNYVISPNFNLFAQYLYGSVAQKGAGKTHSNSLGLGAALKW
jgi:hypothetical protein